MTTESLAVAGNVPEPPGPLREFWGYFSANHGAAELRDYAKSRIKELGLKGKGKVRINVAGCLDRCEEGPVLVVYPDAVWYTYVDRDDIDEIIDRHVVGGEVVVDDAPLQEAADRVLLE